jgi:hypothetical protein
MNEGDPKNREHWVQIITTIPEISSVDHSRNQTLDKRILYVTNAVFSINLNWLSLVLSPDFSIMSSFL